ncbi:MAG: Crp/Fnr family transcriptional regulator [Bacteroidota bacterium]
METYKALNAEQLKDFEALSEVAKKELLASSESIIIPKGTLLFEENEPLTKLYSIEKGACKFSKVDSSGQEHILRFLGAGEVMGKRAVWTQEGAKVSATALTETQLCCFDKDAILKHLEKNPKFCRDFLDALVEDVNINEHIRMIFCIHKGIKYRLAQLLLYLLDKFGADEKGKLRVRLKREDMAPVLGTSQEYIINLLKSFKNFGLIDVIKSEIYIQSQAGLIEMTR